MKIKASLEIKMGLEMEEHERSRDRLMCYAGMKSSPVPGSKRVHTQEPSQALSRLVHRRGLLFHLVRNVKVRKCPSPPPC